MPALDIFSGSAFSMVALTDAINKMPYVPGRIGQLGLFREQGVSTTSVMIEEREGSLNLVETTARGAPAIQNTTNKRKARSLVVPHIALEDTILADEVQNVRAFGSESMLEGVQAVVNQRMSEMASKMDATLEHLRIGAIKGQILDADGSAVIYDLFTEFGVTAHTEIDFDLDNATPAPGVIKKKCHDIRRKIEDVGVRVIARRPDTIVGFGETRIHAETATFEVRASEIASPRPGDQITIGGETFVVQGEPELRDPDRLVWTLDTRPI
jgi:hypothetical protein